MSAPAPISTCTCAVLCPACSLPRCRPHQDVSWAEGTLRSSYQDDYPQKESIQGSAIGPGKQQVDTLFPLDDRTTQRLDYSPKSAKYKLHKPRVDVMPCNVLDSLTTNRLTYDAKVLSPSTAGKEAHDSYCVPLETATTQRTAFQGTPGRPAECLSPKIKVVTAPFTGTSSYRDDFSPKSPVPGQGARAKAPALQSSTIGSSTTYGEDFVARPLPKAAKPPCCSNAKHH